MRAISRTLLAVAFSGLVSACTPLLIGSAAVATYEVAKDDRTAGEVATDTRIVADIKQKLLRNRQVSGWDINVDSFRREVTLHGNVPTANAKETAILLATSVKGVEKVVSKLVIVPRD